MTRKRTRESILFKMNICRKSSIYFSLHITGRMLTCRFNTRTFPVHGSGDSVPDGHNGNIIEIWSAAQ